MTWQLLLLFGVGLSALLGGATHFYAQANRAKRSAILLDRIGSGERIDDVALLGIRPQRLAKNKRMQALLRDAPFVSEMAEMLDAAGMAMTVLGLLGRMFGTGFAMATIGRFIGLDPAPALLIGFFAGSVPIMFIVRARLKRATAFEAQLPQALELIALYLRSGRSLPQAFIAASEEILPPASEEFGLCAEEYRLGRPLDVSLRRLAQRYPESTGFRLFSIAVSVLGQTGGNLVEVLERIKKTLDAGITYGLRLKAMTGESRMSAWILSFLPGLFMVAAAVFNPSYFNTFFDNSLGQFIFMVFVSLWAIGIFWIRALMQSKVV